MRPSLFQHRLATEKKRISFAAMTNDPTTVMYDMYRTHTGTYTVYDKLFWRATYLNSRTNYPYSMEVCVRERLDRPFMQKCVGKQTRMSD